MESATKSALSHAAATEMRLERFQPVPANRRTPYFLANSAPYVPSHYTPAKRESCGAMSTSSAPVKNGGRYSHVPCGGNMCA